MVATARSKLENKTSTKGKRHLPTLSCIGQERTPLSLHSLGLLTSGDPPSPLHAQDPMNSYSTKSTTVDKDNIGITK